MRLKILTHYWFQSDFPNDFSQKVKFLKSKSFTQTSYIQLTNSNRWFVITILIFALNLSFHSLIRCRCQKCNQIYIDYEYYKTNNTNNFKKKKNAINDQIHTKFLYENRKSQQQFHSSNQSQSWQMKSFKPKINKTITKKWIICT